MLLEWCVTVLTIYSAIYTNVCSTLGTLFALAICGFTYSFMLLLMESLSEFSGKKYPTVEKLSLDDCIYLSILLDVAPFFFLSLNVPSAIASQAKCSNLPIQTLKEVTAGACECSDECADTTLSTLLGLGSICYVSDPDNCNHVHADMDFRTCDADHALKQESALASSGCNDDATQGFLIGQSMLLSELALLTQVYLAGDQSSDCRALLFPLMVGRFVCTAPSDSGCDITDLITTIAQWLAAVASVCIAWLGTSKRINPTNVPRLFIRSCRVLLLTMVVSIPFTILLMTELTCIHSFHSVWIFDWIIRDQVQPAVNHFLSSHSLTKTQLDQVNNGDLSPIRELLSLSEMSESEIATYGPILRKKHLSVSFRFVGCCPALPGVDGSAPISDAESGEKD
jgi:hypothetical protein